MIANETAATIIAQLKANGERVALTLTDGSLVIGDPISINSKGVNLKDARDGKVITRALSKVTVIEAEAAYLERTETEDDVLGDLADPAPEGDETELDIDEAEDGIADVDIDDTDGDGFTTADLAAIFDMPAKELRKVTRALGLGVGRGRVYSFDQDDVTKIRKELKVRAAADNA